MTKLFTTGILCLALTSIRAQVHPNDNLWYNNGAEVFIGTNCLLTVQGDVTNNQAGFSGITHLTNNGLLWVQGNLYGDHLFTQSGNGITRMQNKTDLYTAPYAGENYQVISGGYQVHGAQADMGTNNDGSFYDLQLDNSNGSVFITDSTDVRSSIDFQPTAANVDGITIASAGIKNTLRTYDPGSGAVANTVPANGADYTAVFGMMNNAEGLASFKNVSTNLMANAAMLDSGYIQGKLRRAINPLQGGTYGFPIGLEPSSSDSGARGIQYISLQFSGVNNYGVVSGYFQQGSDNTVVGLDTVCSALSDFKFYGADNHGEWIMQSSGNASDDYGVAIYPQDYGNVSSEVYFITKSSTSTDSNTVTGAQNCGVVPVGISNNNLTGFSKFGFGGGSTQPLGLGLLRFEAIANGCFARLKWQTANEENLHHFDIEYSTDGRNFEQIGSVNYNPTNNFEFIWTQPDKTGFYRLAIVDESNHAGHSEVVQVSTNCTVATGEILMVPNPVSDILTIGNLMPGKKIISVINAVGAILQSVNTEATTMQLNMQPYASGLYNIRIENASGVITSNKIVKM